LRALKGQHDELRAKLDAAEAQVHKLPTHAVIELHIYLERHFVDPALSKDVQTAIVKLLECLCMICHIDISPDTFLDSTRRLLRDPHGFTSRLCNTPLSGEDAKSLAPFLLSNMPYKRIRDRNVNACYDALHSWISAKYWYAAIADQADHVAEELKRQEGLLCQVQPVPSQTPATPNTFSAVSLTSTSPSHFQRAVSIGTAMLRAMSGSPVGSLVLRRRSPGRSEFADAPNRGSAAACSQGFDRATSPHSSNLERTVSSSSFLGNTSPVGQLSVQPAGGLERHKSVPATLLEAMHPRPDCAAASKPIHKFEREGSGMLPRGRAAGRTGTRRGAPPATRTQL